MKFLNRLLYQVHRWVGLVLALFMFLWFVTGLVILYAPAINQSRAEQLAHAETLAPEIGWLSLGDVWERSAAQRKALFSKGKTAEAKVDKVETEAAITDARLVRSAGEPLWLVEDSRGQRFALSAVDGHVHETTEVQALMIAENWASTQKELRTQKARLLEKFDSHIMLRNQEALKPFYHIALGEAGTQLMISARTGEILHASTTLGRGFYWAGNWLHLFKPLEAIGWGGIRHDVQLWLSFSATLATLTGLIIGWLRWRPGFNGKPTYSQGRTQPYREFWFKWHFWSGLLGGSAALFWALSGYIDTNPGKIFSQANPTKPELTRYFGAGLPQAMRDWQPILPLALATNAADVVEISWKRLANDAVLLANTRDGERIAPGVDGVKAQFDEADLRAAVARVEKKAPISSVIVSEQYDSYYYPRHHQTQIDKPLPVVVVRLADEVGTRFYLDPTDGKLLAKLDRSARLFRWLYSALHHWDFGWVYYRPLWDIWMLTWVSFGVVLGGSSLVIGWRLLKKTVLPKKSAKAVVPASTRYASSEA